jgi:LEA14-like dessication related protein
MVLASLSAKPTVSYLKVEPIFSFIHRDITTALLSQIPTFQTKTLTIENLEAGIGKMGRKPLVFLYKLQNLRVFPLPVPAQMRVLIFVSGQTRAEL